MSLISVLGFLLLFWLCAGPVVFSLILWQNYFIKNIRLQLDKILDKLN